MRHLSWKPDTWTPIGSVSFDGYVSLNMADYANPGMGHVALKRDIPTTTPVKDRHSYTMTSLLRELQKYDEDVVGLVDAREGVIITWGTQANYEFSGQRLRLPSPLPKSLIDIKNFFAFNKIAGDISLVMDHVESAGLPGRHIFVSRLRGSVVFGFFPDVRDAGDAHSLTEESAGELLAEYSRNLKKVTGTFLTMGKQILQLDDTQQAPEATSKMFHAILGGDASVLGRNCVGIIIYFKGKEARVVDIPVEYAGSPLFKNQPTISSFRYGDKTYWMKKSPRELKMYLALRDLHLKGYPRIGMPIKACGAFLADGQLRVFSIFPDVQDLFPGMIIGTEAGPQAEPYADRKVAEIARLYGVIADDVNPGNYFFDPKTKAVEFIDLEHWTISNPPTPGLLSH